MLPGVISGIFGIGSKLIDHWFPDAEEGDKRKAELLTLIQEGKMVELEAAAKVISAESSSEHWIVAAWRPLTMLTFTAIIANNYILYPYLSLFWQDAVKLDLPPDLWDLLKLGLSGYIIGRSTEKAIKEYKKD